MTNIIRQAAHVIVAGSIVAVGVGGCANDDSKSNTPPENTGSRAQALTTEVERAAAQPSGNLSEGSIAGLFAALDDWDVCVGNGDLPGGLSFDLDGLDDACVTGNEMAGSVDLACASGGEASGTVSFEVNIDGETVYVHYQFDDACLNGVCADGEGAVKVGFDQATGSSEVVVAGELTLYFQGEWRELKYGVTLQAGSFGATTDVVLWVDGESYVVHLSSGDIGSAVAVQAGNGSWECNVSAADGAYSGSCSGEGDIQF